MYKNATTRASLARVRILPGYPSSCRRSNATFASIRDRISTETYKAITFRPFQLSQMTEIQEKVLPLLPELAAPHDPLSKVSPVRDLLIQAKTGTGKTLAFLVPVIEARVRAIKEFGQRAVMDAGMHDNYLEARAQRVFAKEHVGALILTPTRELAAQIATEALRLSSHHDGFEVRLLVGGASKKAQMRDWNKGRRDIVVSTPGRLRDLLTSEPEIAQGLAKTRTFILDEADTLLDMGFRDDIDAIKAYLPPTPLRQTMLASATISPAVRQVAHSVLDTNHAFIRTVNQSESPVHAHIPQYHTILPSAAQQIPHVMRLITHDQLVNPGRSKIILFLPTTKMTQLFATLIRELRGSTIAAGLNTNVYEIHSKRLQAARNLTSEAFRQDVSGSSILVTSDISARGVDYPAVTRVIQVGIPAGTEQYIHRIGRTGRGDCYEGRGDLVLLPWEAGFIDWHLREIPLKPLSMASLIADTKERARVHDENPEAFWRPVTELEGPVIRFAGSVTASLSSIKPQLAALIKELDEEAVKETFASLLGYYVAKSPELRTSKETIAEGLRDWSMEACGLQTPPYVSKLYLAKLGMGAEDANGKKKKKWTTGRSSTDSDKWDVEAAVGQSTEQYSGEREKYPWRKDTSGPKVGFHQDPPKPQRFQSRDERPSL